MTLEVAMRYTILLERRPDGTYEASVPSMPQVAEHGESRAAALVAIEQAIRARLRNVELVDLEIPIPSPTNPWLETAGMFADDPEVESILEEIYAARDASKGE
jgi:predicted RNase H-like HicB family nuclease